MGLFEIKIFSKFPKITTNVKNLNFFKSLIFGMCFSISMTPCVGTFLTSALLLIASKESLIKGIILILIYSLGLGIPFIISIHINNVDDQIIIVPIILYKLSYSLNPLGNKNDNKM